MNDFSPKAESAVIKLAKDVFERGVVGNQEMLMSYRGRGVILQNIKDGKEEEVSSLDRFYDVKTAIAFVREQSGPLTKTLWPEKPGPGHLRVGRISRQAQSHVQQTGNGVAERSGGKIG